MSELRAHVTPISCTPLGRDIPRAGGCQVGMAAHGTCKQNLRSACHWDRRARAPSSGPVPALLGHPGPR
eukprot:CAMPEP_0179279842 /NCGR_PEP_ID=MMETSP0797-20121207/36323_1 /TAXON_ID=47934 /ORGANISM="Dinophysis acuminata, Strain DAEP01" /LENGTH=68 /DNA_ID=CAMNT_0020988485 /DNA_START=61 /DNA_END=264 /DNA_ORIENTATION=+